MDFLYKNYSYIISQTFKRKENLMNFLFICPTRRIQSEYLFLQLQGNPFF